MLYTDSKTVTHEDFGTKSKKELAEIFFRAVKYHDVKMINECLDYNADRNSSHLNQEIALFLAAENGLLKIVERLIKRKEINGNTPTVQEYTPLIIATIYAHTDVIITLINNGLDINYQKKLERSPLHWAVIMQNIKICTILLKAGANPNIFDGNGATPLFYAAIIATNIVLTELLLKFGAKPHISLPCRMSTLLEMCLIARFKHHFEILELLLSKVDNVNIVEPYFKRTALHIVAINDNNFAVKILLAKGANREAKDICNRRPIDIADIYQNKKMSFILKKYIPPKLLLNEL